MKDEDKFEIEEIYKKYKHLDKLICDTALDDSFKGHIIRDLWKAIKLTVKKGDNK